MAGPAAVRKDKYKANDVFVTNMLLQELLGLKEDVYLIESGYEGLEVNLKTLDYLDKLGTLPAGPPGYGLLIIDKNGGDLGVAFKNKHPEGDFWFVIPYPRARASRVQTEKLASAVLNSGIDVKTKKVDGEAFKAALREYLAVSLAGGSLCDCNKEREPRSFAFNEERNKRISGFLEKLAKEHGLRFKNMSALEICCGNGMSTAPIKPLFKDVLSVDNDRCAICNGVYHEALQPAEVMAVDAMELTRFIDKKYDALLGFMLGTIYEFNKSTWRTIFKESLKMLGDNGFLLFTVNKREEIDFVASALKPMGVNGKIIDNQGKNDIYDGWAFFALKKNGHFIN